MTPPGGVDSTCAALATARDEPLDATAAHAPEWLAVEFRGQWGRDAVADTDLPAPVRERLGAHGARVVLVRRPERRGSDCTVFRAVVGVGGGTLYRLRLPDIDALATADLDQAEPVPGPLLLVCAHGRRDACCARLGVPVFDALARTVDDDLVWQSTHLGGHRFAANVLVLPHGLQLGRVRPTDVPGVLHDLHAHRIPLEHYRGRTLYTPRVQAAEVAVRRRHGYTGVDDLALADETEGDVRFALAGGGEVVVHVERGEDAVAQVSCGGAPEPIATFVVSHL